MANNLDLREKNLRFEYFHLITKKFVLSLKNKINNIRD